MWGVCGTLRGCTYVGYLPCRRNPKRFNVAVTRAKGEHA